MEGLLVLYLSNSTIGGGRRFGKGGKTTGGLRAGVPSRVQGRSPGRGSGTKSPRSWRIFKVVTSQFYAFLVYFTHFHLYMPMFFSPCLQASFHYVCEIGAFDTICPPCPQVGGGATAPSAPSSAAYEFNLRLRLLGIACFGLQVIKLCDIHMSSLGEGLCSLSASVLVTVSARKWVR